MKALFLTREFPPYVYGGAGVHVEYLAKELSELMEIDVRAFGDQNAKGSNLNVIGYPFEDGLFENSDDKLKSVFKTLRTGLHMNADKIDSSIYLMKIIGPYGPVHPILFLMITLGYYWRNDSLRDFLARKANAVFSRQ